MKTHYAVALSLLAGAAAGAAAIHTLHAQAKPPVYYVAEIEITNLEGWSKDYAPKAQALIREMGGRTLASGQNVTSLEGEAPKTRVAVQRWDSMEQIKAWMSNPEYKELKALREKYGKVRAFTVEGMPGS
jgi:uncharacterized protein (DUF1330 family)